MIPPPLFDLPSKEIDRAAPPHRATPPRVRFVERRVFMQLLILTLDRSFALQSQGISPARLSLPEVLAAPSRPTVACWRPSQVRVPR